MIDSVRFFITDETLPYRNIALEEHLLNSVHENECVLYLWQNHKTVVIGRNQNAWKECRLEELEREGGHLARRLSGGGAVFHDMGNLNFTFFAKSWNYDVDKQLGVILQAVHKAGIDAEATGRNDITVSGRKFSGNAFYQTGENRYHHGTILVNADMAELTRYLTVSAGKIKSHGVDSVRSRVANLNEFNVNLTIDEMKTAMFEAFGEVYGVVPSEISEHDIDRGEVEKLKKKFSSREWLFGRSLNFTWEAEKRFEWGSVQLQLVLDNGRVKDAVMFSDALDTSFIPEIPNAMIGAEFSRKSLVTAVMGVEYAHVDDICRFIEENV